jgi:hypothetical protein
MAASREWTKIDTEVTQLKIQLEKKKAELDRAQKADAETLQAFISPIEREAAQAQDSILSDLKMQMAGLRQMLEDAKSRGIGGSFPRYEKEIEETKKFITQRQADLEQELGRRSSSSLSRRSRSDDQ